MAVALLCDLSPIFPILTSAVSDDCQKAARFSLSAQYRVLDGFLNQCEGLRKGLFGRLLDNSNNSKRTRFDKNS
jgi:hypothetical protein